MAQPLFKIRLFYPCGIFKSNFKDVRRLRNQRRLNPYFIWILSNTGLFFYLNSIASNVVQSLSMRATTGYNSITASVLVYTLMFFILFHNCLVIS